MFKNIIFIFILVTFSLCNLPFAQNLHHQHGIFLPTITPYSASQNGDVMYNRFCKALCCLYVPVEPVCGVNNVVYENACMARCDRIAVDESRIRFNNKCCCQAGSDVITGVAATTFSIVDTGNANAILFSIPTCLQECLDINEVNDVESLIATIAVG